MQQSRKLPSDAVRVPPSVASLCSFSVGRGLPFRCSRPTAPFGPQCDASVCHSELRLRARLRTGPPTPGAAEPLAPFGCMGALNPMRQTRLALGRKGDSPLRCSRAASYPSDAVRVPPSVASLCLFSVGRGSPSGAGRPTAPFGPQCDASVCHFELRCVLGGGRGSHSRRSRAAWLPRL